MVFIRFFGLQLEKNPASGKICQNPKDLSFIKSRGLPVKQAQIKPEKPKWELRPFLTIFATP